MTKEEYAVIKTYMVGAYHNFEISDIVWYDNLKRLDFKTAFEAIKRHLFPLSQASSKNIKRLS